MYECINPEKSEQAFDLNMLRCCIIGVTRQMEVEMNHTQREKDRAEKKVEIAIDKMIDLKDMGFGDSSTENILDQLNRLCNKIRSS